MSLVHRRTVLRAGLAAAAGGLLSGCTGGAADPATFMAPDGPEVRAAERKRNPGAVREMRLSAVAGPVDLGGPVVTTWSYGGLVPGGVARIKAGEVIRATLTNELPEHTTIHWHGLALRNDADGVPGVTQQPVIPGAEHVYEFSAARPGTYWFHPHAGLQLDRGLYAPLIVEDPHEPLRYDAEWVVVLDDWLDGVGGRSPQQQFGELREGAGGMMGGHMAGVGSSDLLGGDAGDVPYPYFLLNGRVPDSPVTFSGKPGSRVRLRIVNAAGDTAFRVALGGHQLTVTHADGFPVEPMQTDAVLIGMGERYDVLFTLADGVFPLVALAEGKDATARGIVRTSSGAVPTASLLPRELYGEMIGYRRLRPAEAVRLPGRHIDRTISLQLTGGMMSYEWAFDNRRFDPDHLIPIRFGERVRLMFTNATMMWHPVHLHGHTFALGETGVRKDTAIVLPGQAVSAVFDADNPGRWMVHCHNVYHAEAGMMTLLGYQR